MMKNSYVYKFLIVGSCAFTLNYFVLLTIARYTDVSNVVAETIGMLVSLQFSFVLHDHWTYIDPQTHEGRYLWRTGKRYVSYLLSNSIGSLITIGIFGLISDKMPHFFALAIASITAMFWNFMANKLYVWRKATETPVIVGDKS